MNEAYARLHDFAFRTFSSYSRGQRMKRFVDAMQLRGGERVIDLGGTVKFWDDVPVPLDITVLNLPGELPETPTWSRHEFRLLEGDACQVAGQPDRSFDIVFSNSVIEHVGGAEKRRAMALEVRRLAPRHWVQTPSVWFPIEAHTYMPFWWFYPETLKAHFMRRWTERLPAWAEMLRDTTVVHHGEMRELFPESRILTERFLGIPKSYVAIRA